METLLNKIYFNGPQVFSKKRLSIEPDIFKARTALFYTPTDRIPAKWIGTGKLDVTLPIPSPTIYEWHENSAYRVPRLWVDLLQRATSKIRWTPISPAQIRFIRYDIAKYDDLDIIAGAKSVLDALKSKSTGRSDGMTLYYFGAIWNDDQRHLSNYLIEQILIDSPSKASLRIIVEGPKMPPNPRCSGAAGSTR